MSKPSALFATPSTLPARERTRQQEWEQRHASPTLQEIKYGNPSALAKRTSEAVQLAAVCDAARAHIAAIADVHWRTLADETMTEAGRHARSGAHAKIRLGAFERQLTGALDSAERRLSELKERIDTALRPAGHAGEASIQNELRRHIASIVSADPAKALALIGSDGQARYAVASGPALLSGLTPEIHRRVQRDHVRAVDPNLVDDFDDLAAAVDAATKARDTLKADVATLVNVDGPDAVRAAIELAKATD